MLRSQVNMEISPFQSPMSSPKMLNSKRKSPIFQNITKFEWNFEEVLKLNSSSDEKSREIKLFQIYPDKK